MCNCNTTVHRVTNLTTGTTTVNLAVTNDTNIGNLEPFTLIISKCKSVNIPASPLPVTITINDTAMPLLDKNGIQIQSNMIPYYSHGRCVLEATTAVTESTDSATQATVRDITVPYVILYNTPRCKC